MSPLNLREVSTSPQRLRTLLRGRPEKLQLGERVKMAFERYGLRVEQIAVTAAIDAAGYVLDATGWHEDGTPFAIVKEPVTGEPVAFALKAAASVVAAHTGNAAPDPAKLTELDVTPAAVAPAVNPPAPLPQSPFVTTPPAAQPPLPAFLLRPKVKAMATTTTKAATHKALTFADRLKTISKKIDSDLETGLSTLEQLEASAAAANAGIASVVAQKAADVGALTDVLNQLTNGDGEDETDASAETQGVTAAPATGETNTQA